MKRWVRHNRKKAVLAGAVLAGVVLVSLVITAVRFIRGSRVQKPDYSQYSFEGMSEMTPEEIEAYIKREEAKETLTGFGNVESLAGLASNGNWIVDEPGDQGWSLSEAAPFFMKIRFDHNYEMILEEQSSLWRRIYKGDYLWDNEAVYDYFQSLKEKYDTPPGEVRFTTHDGRELLFHSNNCGWQMNIELTVDALKAALDAGEEIMDPVWNSGLVYSSENGVGSKYVEVDIPAQKTYLYEDGKQLLETDCVTGTKDFSDTETGVFQVMYKSSPSVLKDEDKYGNKYEQPVNYWISFNYSQGLHDAVWRYAFGGDIYLTSGSHGCVNLTEEAARVIYEEVYNYFPVIVYDDSIPEVKASAGEEEAVEEIRESELALPGAALGG